MAISVSDLVGRVRSELQGSAPGVLLGVEACDQNGARARGSCRSTVSRGLREWRS